MAALVFVACGQVGNSYSLEGTSSRGVPIPASGFYLEGDGKGINLQSGNRVSIEPKSVVGYIDNAFPEQGQGTDIVSLNGWAASANLGQSADAVVAFVDGQAVAALRPTGERPDVANGYEKPGLEGIGFVLSVPVSSLDCAAPNDGLRVFGIHGTRAAALAPLGNVEQIIASACR